MSDTVLPPGRSRCTLRRADPVRTQRDRLPERLTERLVCRLGDVVVVGARRVHVDRATCLDREPLERTAQAMKVSLDVQIEVESASSIRSLVARGTFFTAFQLAAAHADVLQGRFAAARIIRPTITRRLSLTTTNWVPLSEAARYLLTVLRQEMTRLIRDGRWPTSRPSREAS